MRKHFAWMMMLAAAAALHAQKFGGLALTPPMGWNSWNHFGCNVNEDLIRETAGVMVASGMKDAGYRYVVIDDCWHGARDSLGFIHPDPDRFPSGMKALADYIHSLGLKFGIYSDAGWRTCGGRPGSRGYEYQDALTYAEWGVDYLKYDWCNTEDLNPRGAYMTMRDALYAAGRPVVFSLCEWGNSDPWLWARDVGHLWRTTGDIGVIFDGEEGHGIWTSWGVLQILDMREGIRIYAGPDHWNDPDMMEVGNGMTVEEDRAHFSLWCMQAAPLMAGNDIRTMSKTTRDILTNREVIAVDQDSMGIQGFRYLRDGSLDVWAKPLQEGCLALCFLNRAVTPREVHFAWEEHAIRDDFVHVQYVFNQQAYRVRDLWAGRDLGTTVRPFAAVIPPHGVRMMRLTPIQ